MRLKHYISSLIVTLLAGSSCSTINEITGRTPAAGTKTEQKSAKTSSNKQRGKRKKNNEIAQVQSVQQADNVVRKFTKTDSIALTKRLAGEWFFENVAGIKVEGEDNRPSLTFDENVARFYASNGCNYYNGNYVVNGFNSIAFQNVISTSNICYEIPWADYITAMWNIASGMYITTRGSEEYLDIRDSKERSLATLRRHQLGLLNGLWSIVEINGRHLNGTELPTIVIDLLERTIHGNTGCNLFNGTIYQNPDVDRSVQFQDMRVTRVACPNTAVETAFLVALEQVEQAIIENDDEAVLTDNSGRRLLLLKRTSPE